MAMASPSVSSASPWKSSLVSHCSPSCCSPCLAWTEPECAPLFFVVPSHLAGISQGACCALDGSRPWRTQQGARQTQEVAMRRPQDGAWRCSVWHPAHGRRRLSPRGCLGPRLGREGGGETAQGQRVAGLSSGLRPWGEGGLVAALSCGHVTRSRVLCPGAAH